MNLENENVEFKLLEAGSLPKTFIKEVIGMLNSNGGIIYIGIDDKGNPVGVEDPDDVKIRITNSVRDNIRPEMLSFISIKDEIIEDRWIVKIIIQSGTLKPYYQAGKGIRPEGVSIRKGSASIPASEATIKELLMETAGRSYEKERSIEQDLTFKIFESEMNKRGHSIGNAQMKTLGLIGKDDLYTNLALLLSDQCPFEIKVAVFQGNDSIIFRDRKEFGGSVLKQLENVYEHLSRLNKVQSEVIGLHRHDHADYPQEAIREALLNCIVHRDYAFSGATIINVYDDHMEFNSLGSLVPGISMEAVMKGVSQSRNPRLAQLFYRMELVESYGTGIKKIKQLYADEKEPVFESPQGGFFVTLYNRNETKKATKSVAIKEKHESNIIEMILNYAKENDGITRSEVETLTGYKQTKAFNILKKLCDDGQLEQIKEGKLSRFVIV